MAYSEIINEIQEQIADINRLVVEHTDAILEKQVEIEESEERIASLQAQLVGLTQLQTNAQSLIDNQNSLDINLNVNVAGAGEGSNVIRHSSSANV